MILAILKRSFENPEGFEGSQIEVKDFFCGGGEFLNLGVRCGSMWRSNPERILKRSLKMDPGGSPEADAEVKVKDFFGWVRMGWLQGTRNP